MIQNLSLRGGTTKQSHGLQDIEIATLHFVTLAMTTGHFFTWSTLTPNCTSYAAGLTLHKALRAWLEPPARYRERLTQ